MIRMGSWFKRKPTTLWLVKEFEVLEGIGKIPEEDLELMEKYYTARIRGSFDARRRDLITLLNNWQQEMDRAAQYENRKGSRPL